MTSTITEICLLILVGALALKWGYSDGKSKGYDEGLEDGAQLFRASLLKLNKRISDLERENEELRLVELDQHHDNAE